MAKAPARASAARREILIASSLAMVGFGAKPRCPASIEFEDRAGDVPDTAVHLDRVVLAVEVVGRKQPARRDLDDAGIAEIPAAAIVAQDQLLPPAAGTVFADA